MEAILLTFLCVCTGQQAAGTRVVIHVGPHKTGTKSVQSHLDDQRSLLQADAWTLQDGAWTVHGSVQISYFYVQSETRKRNQVAYDSWLKTIAQLKGTTNNMLISCERFAKANETQIAEFASDLSQTNTTIVMVYRPYYEWIASVYREIKGAGHGAVLQSAEYVDWLFPPDGSRSGNTNVRSSHLFVPHVYNKYAANFSDIRIHKLGPNLVADIVCDDLNATWTCAALRNSTMKHNHISPKGHVVDGCLSPLQLQELQKLSADLHKEVFGTLEGFSTSDLYAQSSNCFGNR